MTDRANPEMLVVARESRRLTQPELSRRIGVGQSTLSKAENGVNAASGELLQAYSTELKYPVSFFFETPPSRRLPVTFYRKRKSVGNPALRAIDAQMTVLRLHLRKMLRSVEAPKATVPSVTLKKHGLSASDLAQEMRARWHVKSGPIANVAKLLEDHGIFVIKWHFDIPNVDGLSIYSDEEGLPPVIVLDPSFPGDRLRFTAIHELGHMVMHHHLALPGARCEEEADEFAGEFLMPGEDLRAFLRGLSLQRLATLKAHWRTSMRALLYRAGELGEVSEGQKKRLWATMSSLGYTKKEPVEVPPEEPTLVKELAAFHMDRLGYSLAELSKAMSADEDEFSRTYMGTAAPGSNRLRVLK